MMLDGIPGARLLLRSRRAALAAAVGRAAADGGALKRFAMLLGLALLLLLAGSGPDTRGDFPEYALTAVALAGHGTPDIRIGDIDAALALSPDPGYKAFLGQLKDGVARGEREPQPGFLRGKNGDTYAIHFFAYPALAAVPLRIFQALGLDPFKAFQAVNYAALWLLGLCLLAWFGTAIRAAAGVALFLACGGVLYANWCGPEMLTACFLLSGMLLCVLQRPLAGGVLAGIAAMQNPPLVFFALFGPLLGALHVPAGARWFGQLRGSVAAMVLALLPFAFFQWQFGMPSMVATASSDPGLASLTRLASYYFDMNQGMILCLPALPLLLAGCYPRERQGRAAVALLATVLFMLALALPTLSTTNWNSGENGVMRYVFWGGMPLLFLALGYLKALPRWPARLLGAVFLLQALAMVHAGSYAFTAFSPVGNWMLAHLPALSNPEPEIFAERALHFDGALRLDSVVRYRAGDADKLLFNADSDAAQRALCGIGRGVADEGLVARPGGWRYANGLFQCVERPEPIAVLPGAFGNPESLIRLEGWSMLERRGGVWNGMWTDGPRARMLIPMPTSTAAADKGFRQIRFLGQYLKPDSATGVIINGHDLGTVDLARPQAIALPPLGPGERGYEIEFQHKVSPPPPGPESRRLGFFLREVRLR